MTGSSEMPADQPPHPFRFCGSDTAPGQPGHGGSQPHFDADACNL